jgi:hypothetical protein
MIETATENKGMIFAYDCEGYDICVDDKVIYRRKEYVVEHMEHEITTDGYYTETVYLLLTDKDTGKYVVVEDEKVKLVFD